MGHSNIRKVTKKKTTKKSYVTKTESFTDLQLSRLSKFGSQFIAVKQHKI